MTTSDYVPIINYWCNEAERWRRIATRLFWIAFALADCAIVGWILALTKGVST